jgi:RNA polymerase sigma-70 factor (ECF subfamily)
MAATSPATPPPTMVMCLMPVGRDGTQLRDVELTPDVWSDHRRYLFAVAYRLLGSAADAEDAVQEAFLRLHRLDGDVRDVRAWLTTVVSRIGIDVLRSARYRRESYVGIWLPEPLVDYDDTDLGDVVVLRESLRPAVLLVLEQLTPAERVVFVLHDVFGMDFGRVAEVVDRTRAACRQLAARARHRVRESAPPRASADAAEVDELVRAITEASRDGDIGRLVTLLDPDVVVRSDGGGVVLAARRSVHGAAPVATFFARLTGKLHPGLRLTPVSVGTFPGLLLVDGDEITGVVQFEVEDGRLAEANLVLNPDKLARIGAIGSR